MRFIVNPLPPAATPQPLPEGWTLIRQPTPRRALTQAIAAGLGLLGIPLLLLGLESWLFPIIDTRPIRTIGVWTLPVVVVVSVVLHELLHLLGHPGGGGSSASHVLVWPRKLQIGVFYDGFMTRTRWLVMRLAPLFGLTVLPALLLLAVYPFLMDFYWQMFMVLVLMVNSLGAGGDLIAARIVARQVPRGGEIGIWQGRACWR
jgi:hypothetical protein